QMSYPGMITLLEERRRGKSKALNAAIEATGGDLVGMIDDDEEFAPQWLAVIADAFTDPHLDFIGGPYVPICDTPLPDWLPDENPPVAAVGDNATSAPPRGACF